MAESIEIRRVEPSDGLAIKEIYACKSVYNATLQLPYPSQQLWDKRLSNLPDNVYAFVATLDGSVVGNIGLEVNKNPRRRHVASFGMGVKDEVQGRGIGKSLLETTLDLADNWLNLIRIELTVYTDNDAAIGLYKKFGFTIEGESAMYAYRDGHYVSALQMARIKETPVG